MQATIEISDEIAGELQRRAPDPAERAALLETIVIEWLSTHPEWRSERSDAALIDRHADELNAEAADVLDYQAIR